MNTRFAALWTDPACANAINVRSSFSIGHGEIVPVEQYHSEDYEIVELQPKSYKAGNELEKTRVTEKNQRMFHEELPRPIGPFSPAVRAGDFVFLSGMIGQDAASGRLVAGGVAEQAHQIFHNAATLLRSAGKTLGDAVKVNVYLVDMGDFAAMNEVYSKSFSEQYPARTTIAVAALPLGARIEVELVAR